MLKIIYNLNLNGNNQQFSFPYLHTPSENYSLRYFKLDNDIQPFKIGSVFVCFTYNFYNPFFHNFVVFTKSLFKTDTFWNPNIF